MFVDVSASMLAKDAKSNLSRLDEAKEVADQLAARMAGHEVALVNFTSEADFASPLTLDTLFVRLMVRNLQVNDNEVSGTDLEKALKIIPKESVFKPRVLILLTDGGDNLLETLSGNEQNTRREAILKAAEFPVGSRTRLDVIGVGSVEGAEIPGMVYEGHKVRTQLQETLLTEIAGRGRGKYYRAKDNSASSIASSIAARIEGDEWVESPKMAQEGMVYEPFYQYPLALAFLLLGISLILPRNFRSFVTACVSVGFGISGLQADLMDEQLKLANGYSSVGSSSQAVQVYRLLLQEATSPWQHAVIAYNMGNTFLSQGSWEEAVGTYDSIVEQDDPVFLSNLSKNSALSRIYWAQQLSDSDLPKGIEQLEQSLEDVKSAKEASCLVQKKMGQNNCEIPQDLNEIERVAKELLKKLKEKPEAKQASPKSGQGTKVPQQSMAEIQFGDTVRTLQEMEKEDRQESESGVVIKEGVRPW